MRARTLILQSLLAIACIALGIVLDRRLLTSRRTLPDNSSRRDAIVATNPPPSPTRLEPRPGLPPDSPGPKLTTIAEVEAALQTALTNRTFSQREQALEALIGAMDPGLISDVLPLAEKIPAGPLRANFIQLLIGRW